MRLLPLGHKWRTSVLHILFGLVLIFACNCADDGPIDPINPSGNISPPDIPAGDTDLCKNVAEEFSMSGGTCPDGHDVNEYMFSWDDGTDSGWTDDTASHTWSEVGSYCVKAKAKCSDGKESAWSECLDVTISLCHTVTTPSIASDDTHLCLSEEGAYTASGGVCSEGHDVNQYMFGWDDGTESDWGDGNASHAWSEVGPACVQAKAMCSEGVESVYSECLNVTVQECGPIADFSGDPANGVAPLVVQFTDLSAPGSAPVTTWSWDFGDGDTSNEQNPSHEYAIGGSYTISLSIATAIGSDVETKENYVLVNRYPILPANPVPLTGAVEVETVDLELNWSGGDPDGDTVIYKVHFGTTTPPPLIDQTTDVTIYQLSYPLFNNTTYYWRIDAIDDGVPQLETVGGDWSFTTETTSTVVLYPVDSDTYANSSFHEQNYCSSSNLFTGGGSDEYRSYIGFDLSSIPSAATIVEGGWKIFLYQVQAFGTVAPTDDYLLFRNLENWSECSLSWNTRPAQDPSANHVQDAVDTGSTWIVLEDPENLKQGWLETLRDMVSGDLPNYGFQIWSNSGDGTYFNFHSANYPDNALRPRMEITFTWQE